MSGTSTLLLLGIGAAALGYFMKTNQNTTVVLTDDSSKNSIPDKKQTQTTKVLPPTIYLYAKKTNTSLYKKYDVAHFQTLYQGWKNNQDEAVYEGEQELTELPQGMYIGTATGNTKNNLIEAKTFLNNKPYLFWVEKSNTAGSPKFDKNRSKTKGFINQIIQNY